MLHHPHAGTGRSQRSEQDRRAGIRDIQYLQSPVCDIGDVVFDTDVPGATRRLQNSNTYRRLRIRDVNDLHFSGVASDVRQINLRLVSIICPTLSWGSDVE